MFADPDVRPPYLDWSLDRWKIGLVLALFVGLLLSAWTEQEPAPAAVSAALPTSIAAGPTVVIAQPAPVGGQPAAAATMPGAPVVADPETVEFPLTLANLGPNAIAPPNGVRVLFGTGAANSLIEVHDQYVSQTTQSDLSPGATQEVLIGVATTGSSGLWQLGPIEPLAPGQHVLSLRQLDAQGRLTDVSPPVVVTVLASGEQGPLALAAPTIRYPTLGARLNEGPVTFVGTGLPGMVVRLYLDSQQAAEATVSSREEWRLGPTAALSPGVYVARVTAVNPQGDVIAESAPLVFVVQETPANSSTLPLSSPTLPLTVSGLAFGDRRRQTLLVRGLATPHAGVAIWLDGKPVKYANAMVDGRWQVWLLDEAGFGEGRSLEARSTLGERVRTSFMLQTPIVMEEAGPPVVLWPKSGDVLTTRRPRLTGLALPASEIAVTVGGHVVGRGQADADGLWALQLVDPLPSGPVSLHAQTGGAKPPLSSPIQVTVAPQL
jgi:hypothetical protein